MFCVYECSGYCVRMDAPYIRCGVDSCEYSYPQKQTTNADHIRAMSDDELNELFHEIYNAGAEDAVAYEWGQRTNSFEWTMEWLKQPAEEDDHD